MSQFFGFNHLTIGYHAQLPQMLPDNGDQLCAFHRRQTGACDKHDVPSADLRVIRAKRLTDEAAATTPLHRFPQFFARGDADARHTQTVLTHIRDKGRVYL